MKTIQQHKDEWFKVNQPFGKKLGYPDCCIKEFCNQPPAVMARMKEPSKDDKRRYKAGFMNGEFTGFIPCSSHAREINMGKITLESLIKDRSPDYPPFPHTPENPGLE